MDTLGRAAYDNKKVRERWLQCDALLIDEVSMISGELFDKVDHHGLADGFVFRA